MRSRLLTPEDEAWMDILRSVEHDIYHLPSYAAAEAQRLGGQPTAVLAEDGDRALLLPLIIRQLPNGVDGNDAVSPYGYPGPLLSASARDDVAFLGNAGGAIVDLLRDMRCCSAFVRCHPLLPQAKGLFGGSGRLREIGPTVWIDLQTPAEERWAAMDPKIRGTVRRTYRDNFAVHVDEGWDALDAFGEIYASTMDRVDATDDYYFDQRYFEALRDALGGQIHLMVVTQSSEVVGAGLFTEASGIVQYHLSGSKRIRGRSPSAVMLDFVCAWAEERGNTMLHLGGGLGGAEDNLLKFKSGFSAMRGSFSVWDVVVDQQLFDLACDSSPLLQSGGGTDGYFPPYREV